MLLVIFVKIKAGFQRASSSHPTEPWVQARKRPMSSRSILT